MDHNTTERSDAKDDADVWDAETYADEARTYLEMSGRLVDRLDIEAEDTVLDIGSGTGNVAITAARRGANVYGVDIAPSMLEKAREHAVQADVDGISWHEGDAVSLPFEADRFDVTVSNLGHMYGDPPDAAAAEVTRVTKPGGRVGFTSWTPTSLYPAMAGVLMQYVDPTDLPDYAEPPFLWGDPHTVRERFGEVVTDLTFETRMVDVPTLSPAHFWERTRSSGHFADLVEAIDPSERPDHREEQIETIASHFDERQNSVELEYRRSIGTASHKEV